MIHDILPACVVAEETRADAADLALFPEEEIALGRAVEKRRREFTTARACAHRALARLSLAPQAIPVGERGEPCWPVGVVGSITHCESYRACALARAHDIASIGIDAEPNRPLPPGVLTEIALVQERQALSELLRATPAVSWDRLLFSAKESVYKAWFPLTRRPLGFADALVVFAPAHRAAGPQVASAASPRERSAVGPCGGSAASPCGGSAAGIRVGTFSAHLLVPDSRPAGGSLTALQGRWLACESLLLTAVTGNSTM